MKVKWNFASAVILCLLTILSCEPDRTEINHVEQLFSGKIKIVDLTHPLSISSPYWPNDDGTPYEYDTLFAHPDGSPAMGFIHAPEHFGTHLDAPIHGGENQPSVDQLTAMDLFGPAVVINVDEKCASNPDYVLSLQDIMDHETIHGEIGNGSIVIMYTGWSKKWEDYESFKNQDDEGKMHFPGFSKEAAEFLITNRDILGIGIDTFSVDAAMADGFPVHGIVNGAGKYHLESMANLHEMNPVGTYLIVAPIKIEGGSGGPVRIFAVFPQGDRQ